MTPTFTPVVTPAVAGLGFRQQTSPQALRQVLDAALAAADQGGAVLSLRALATAEDKCQHPALVQLAADLALPLQPVPLPRLAAQDAQPSAHVPTRYGAHSLAEAAALAAAGPGAVLAGGRHVSADGSATAAIAMNLSETLTP